VIEEQAAIERLQRGDIGGLEFLVRQYQVRAMRTAYLVTYDLQTAQDVVQSAFLKAYERIGQFDPRRPFGPWFLTTVLHDAIKAGRQQTRMTSLEGLSEDGTGRSAEPLEDLRTGPEVLSERAETTAEVRAALARLSPNQRAAVVARYYLALSDAEAAEALAAPVSTVKWRLHAARERLRLLLRPRGTEQEILREGSEGH
jgi:RNA polymerase sigma-70 factor (ECF subfamily)